MEAGNTVAPTEAPSLEQVAHEQGNALWDVIALLCATQDMTEPGATLDDEQANRVHRMARMAEQQTRNVIAAFTPYI